MSKDTYLRVLVPVERVLVDELPRVPVLVPDERVLVLVPDVRVPVLLPDERVLVPLLWVVDLFVRAGFVFDEREVLVVPDVRTRVVVVIVLRAGVDDDCVDVLRVEVDC